MTDTRTDAQKLSDLSLYGACGICGTPRTVTSSYPSGSDTVLSIGCPAGCLVITGGPHALGDAQTEITRLRHDIAERDITIARLTAALDAASGHPAGGEQQ